MTAHDRTALLDALGDHLIRHGLAGASLRPMAKAAGTSDRMLIYYFGTREGLIGEVLQHLAARLSGSLPLTPGVYASDAALLSGLAAALRGPGVRPVMALWLELTAEAARREAPPPALAAVMEGLVQGVAAALPPGPDAPARAAQIVTALEGALVLDCAGRTDLADAALARIAAAM